MKTKLCIREISKSERTEIRHTVRLCMEYWPNAHLGDNSRGEDMRQAFFIIRHRIERGETLGAALSFLESDAYAHSDM